MIRMKMLLPFALMIALVITSCKGKEESSDDEKTAAGRTPVTIASPETGSMDEVTELNATSAFMVKTFVKSNTNGYLQEVNVQLGQQVSKGKRMFVIRSKEAEHLGTTVSALDSSMRFSGTVRIPSPGNGYITQLTYRVGDYVQDGETLAAISDINSLVFMLELPYELRPYLPNNKTLQLILPDNSKITGTLSNSMPMVDPVAQTQRFIIRIPQGRSIPENLVARVNFIKRTKSHTVSLPKSAILTNEVQSEFWIMKMTDNQTAVKVFVQKGIETKNRVEILSPGLAPSDRILISGNYGLPDTAKVVVEKSPTR